MRRSSLIAVLVGAALVVLVPVSAQGANGHANYHAVCPAPAKGAAHCHAMVATDAHGNPRAQSAPYGLPPATIKSAYGFTTSSTAGAGQTVAIVDAYDDPTAEGDLNTFSSQYGLPSCTTANGCFTKVNQTGGTSYPSEDDGWALEISLDVQWAHAIAPGAKILLVEATSNSFSDLLTAESYAAAHAQYVSNSWGGGEFSLESIYDSYFTHAGTSYFVSAGDAGLPAEYPSASPNVISVGGTTLHFDGSGNLTSETGWTDGGGGCSRYESATSAQSGFSGYAQVGCSGKRATPDVSLDADPASGVSVYDSTPYSGSSGWWKVGGTSASSPMWAARSAVAGVQVNAAYVYGSSITYRDITSGNNGAACLVGYDLCSGRGSWNDGGTQPSPDFTLSASPGSVSVTQGSTTASTITITPSNSFGGQVSFSTSSLPTGVTASFSPNPATSSSTLTFTASSTAATGQKTVTITGTSGTLTHTTTVSLTVNAPQTSSFILATCGSLVVNRGGTGTCGITVQWTGSSGSVSLSVSGLPRRTTGTFSPNPATTSSTLTLKPSRNASRGTYNLTITGTSGGNTATATVTLTLN